MTKAWHATAATAGLSLATVALRAVAHDAGHLRRNRYEAAAQHEAADLLGGCGVFSKSSNHIVAATFAGTWAALSAGAHLAQLMQHLRPDAGATVAPEATGLAAQRRERAGMAWTWGGVEAAANCVAHLIFGYADYQACADSSQGLAVNAVLLGTTLVLGLKNLGMAVGSRRIFSAAIAEQAIEPDPQERRAIADRAFKLTQGLRTGEKVQAFAQLGLGLSYFAAMAFTAQGAPSTTESVSFKDLSPLLRGHAYACAAAGAVAALEGVYVGLDVGRRAQDLGVGPQALGRVCAKHAGAHDGR